MHPRARVLRIHHDIIIPVTISIDVNLTNDKRFHGFIEREIE